VCEVHNVVTVSVIDNVRGHEDIIKLLLKQPDIDINARDGVCVHYGNISIVS